MTKLGCHGRVNVDIHTSLAGGRGGGGRALRISSDRDDRMGAKIKTPPKSLGFQREPQKSLNQNLILKKSHVEFPSHKNFQRNYAAKIRGNYHESSDWIPPKNPYLNQATQKNTCQNFRTQKNPEIENFNPKKSFNHPCHLKFELPPPRAHKVIWKCSQIKVAKFGNHSLKKGLQKRLLSPTQPVDVWYSRIPTTRTLLIPQSYLLGE